MTQPITLLAACVFFVASLAYANGTVSITPAAGNDGSSQGGGGDQYEATGVTLASALGFLSPVTLSDVDKVEGLPPGRFDIKIKGYAVRQQPAFDALIAKIKEQFKVDVAVVESEREGFAVSVAADSTIKKSDTEEGTYMTGGPGWVFKGVPIETVGKFLQKELNVPVEASGPDGAYYTFELAVSVFKPEQLPAALEKAGFVVQPKKLKVKTLEAKKAE